MLPALRPIRRGALGAVLVVAAAFNACTQPGPSLAVYEGGSVDPAELDDWAGDLPRSLMPEGGTGDREVLEARITGVAMAKYLVERAERSGAATDRSIEVALRFLLAQDSAGRLLQIACGHSEPTAEEVERAAETLRSQTSREWIVLRHIYKELPPDATAAETQRVRTELEHLRGLVLSGADFSAIARRYSDSATAERGGLIGRISRSAPMVPAVLDAAWELDDGEVSAPIEVSNGFHLLLRESSGTLPQEPSQLRELAHDQILRQQRQQCHDEILADLEAAPDVWLESRRSSGSADSDTPALRVGEESFSAADLELLERAQGVLFSGKTLRAGDLRGAFLEALLLERALLKEHPDEVATHRETETQIRRRLLMNHELLSERRRIVEERSEEELRGYYRQHREAFSTEPSFDASLILVATDGSRRRAWETARRLRRRILAGEDFARLASRHSAHPSAAAGGRIGNRSLSELTALLGTEARRVLLGDEPEGLSPVLQTPRGFALLRVDAVTPPRARTYEEARPLIIESILRERAQALQAELRRRLLEEMRLQLDERAIEAMLERHDSS